ncbi:phage tail fiber protein [Orbus mooreae]|uniref:phage tail fiber protein n=1 Tax=Orbus mooreae TaxID=3074107 RepID=UPI00370D1400
MTMISGILIDGAGQPLPNVQIVLTALKTSSKVIVQSKALITTTSDTGSYSINAQPGNYSVTILRKGFPTEKVGRINVYSDSENGTLNDFLISPSESEITPEILAQVVDERKQAQQAAQSAQTSSNQALSTLNNTVKKTGETTQTVQGTLDATELKENGNRVYSPNNKPTASDVGALSTTGGTLSGNLLYSKYETGLNFTVNKNNYKQFISINDSYVFLMSGTDGDKTRLRYSPQINTWNFESSSVSINNTPVLKQGDAVPFVGLISAGTDLNTLIGSENGVYYQTYSANATLALNYPVAGRVGTLVVYNLNGQTSCSQRFMTYGTNDEYLRNYNQNNQQWSAWFKQITTANSTVDSNGFYKKASPICRLFASDNITEVEGFKIAGCGLVNSEADGVIAKRIDVGHYEIHGSLGFAKEGWYITLPEDANGNKKFFAEYTTDENNIITVKTYTRKFDFEQCAIVAGEPQDITEDRWIDIRLEMPAVEINDEAAPMPSTLNPIIY